MELLVERRGAGLPEEVRDPELDAVGRATDAIIDARNRDMIAQRNAIARLADVLANTPNAVEHFAELQSAPGEVVLTEGA